MNHAPFIWVSYALFAFVLLWTAITPVLRKKKAIDKIQAVNKVDRKTEGKTIDPNT